MAFIVEGDWIARKSSEIGRVSIIMLDRTEISPDYRFDIETILRMIIKQSECEGIYE